MSVSDRIVCRTEGDTWTETNTRAVVRWVDQEFGLPPFEDVVLLATRPGQGLSREDIAQFVIDYANECADLGVWYYLTADANVGCQTEGEGQ